MQLVLNDQLSPAQSRIGELEEKHVKSFFDGIARKALNYTWPQHKQAPEAINHTPPHSGDKVIDFALGWLGVLADCYNRHDKLCVQPHDLWFIAMSELAREVNRQPELYRSLFTQTQEGKQQIVVGTNSVSAISTMALLNELNERVNVDTSLFVPALSTMGPTTQAAFAAVFCDAVQSYYNYATMLCGIREVEVTGTVEDWRTIDLAARELDAIFRPLNGKLGDYFARLSDLFYCIAMQLHHGQLDHDFWSSIYAERNVGSGRDFVISGWVLDLYFEQPKVTKLENFMTSMGTVPFTNLDTGREFTSVHGAFWVLRNARGFLESGYGQVTFEAKVQPVPKGW